MSFQPNVPRASRRKRNLVLAALAVMVLGACGFAVNNYLADKRQPAVNTVTVARGDIENTVTSLGKLKPKDYVDVGTQVSGQLKQVAVKIGDRVKKGDLIAVVDSTVYETRVRTDRANLENLHAQLIQQRAEAKLAEQQLTRNQALLKENAISQETVEENQSTLQVATAKVAATTAQIKASQATLEGDLANLGYTKIYAPMDGTVVSQTSLQGQTVNSNQQAPVIVRVANLQTMTVWAQVAEADVVKVKTGMPAYFATLGDPDRRWKGTVRQIMPTPEVVNDVVLYNILVDVDNSEQELMSDMTVQVFFVLDQARDVLVAPLAALKPAREKGEGGASAAASTAEAGKELRGKRGEGAKAGADASTSGRGRAAKGDKPSKAYRARILTEDGIETRTVQVGLTSRTSAEVLAGLAAGDKLVMPQAEPSKAGQGGAGQGNQGGNRRQAMMGPRL
jgi:membrane fusion protein, macrolide-specific efflux system